MGVTDGQALESIGLEQAIEIRQGLSDRAARGYQADSRYRRHRLRSWLGRRQQHCFVPQAKFLVFKGPQQHIGIGEWGAAAQATRYAPWRCGLQGHQPGPGFAGFGEQDRFAGVGGIDQARELGLGLVHVDQLRLSRGIHLE